MLNIATLLQQFRDLAGAHLNQPGRLLVPGEFDGTPLLQLLPLLPEQLVQGGALVDLMQKHFISYQTQVIEPLLPPVFLRVRPSGGSGGYSGGTQCR